MKHNILYLIVFSSFFTVNNTKKTFELKLDGKGKSGDVTIVLNGMEVNLKNFPAKTGKCFINSNGNIKITDNC